MIQAISMFVAQAASGQENPASIIFLLAPMFLIIYFLILRPQNKRMADHKKFLTTLKKGDHVLTNSGLYGRVWAIDDKVVSLEVAPNVRMKVTLESIAQRARPDGEAVEGDEKAASRA